MDGFHNKFKLRIRILISLTPYLRCISVTLCLLLFGKCARYGRNYFFESLLNFRVNWVDVLDRSGSNQGSSFIEDHMGNFARDEIFGIGDGHLVALGVPIGNA